MTVAPVADDELPRTWPETGLRPHRFAGIFRMLTGDDKAQLDRGVQSRGTLLHKIKVYENAILDGRNRYMALVDTGLFEPGANWFDRPDLFEAFDGSAHEALDLVWALNEERRHDEKGERAMAAARRKKFLDELSATDPTIAKKTDAQLSHEHGVSERLLNSANKVIESAAPEVQAAVDSGAMSVTDAAEVADLPQSEQRIIVETVDRKVIKQRVRAATAKPRKAPPAPELPSPLSRTALSGFAEEAVLLALTAAKKHKGPGASISADAILAMAVKHDIAEGGAKGHGFTRPMLLVLGRLRDTMPSTPVRTETPEEIYARLVAAQGALKGNHTQATAEPLLRAADAASVKISVVAADLGCGKGSIAGWRGRLGLQKSERNPAGASHREGAAA